MTDRQAVPTAGAPTPSPAEMYEQREWRVLMTGRQDGPTNMAIDEAILEAVIAGESGPTLRFYGWEPACLSLGIGQESTDVDWAACAEKGWDVVRRATGGRAILHTDELTYSVCAPLEGEPRVQGSIQQSYERLSAALVAGLAQMGVQPYRAFSEGNEQLQDAKGPVCFDTPANYEITLGTRKLVGSAQMRRRNTVLQHGTLPLFGDITRILDALYFSSDAARTATRRVLRGQATTLADGLGRPVDFDAAVRHMKRGFTQALNLTLIPGRLTEKERATAEQLRAEKYTQNQWTRRR